MEHDKVYSHQTQVLSYLVYDTSTTIEINHFHTTIDELNVPYWLNAQCNPKSLFVFPPLTDQRKMVCDQLASVCGPKWRDGLEFSIGQAATVCKNKFNYWRDDLYPGDEIEIETKNDFIDTVMKVEPANVKFPDGERIKLLMWWGTKFMLQKKDRIYPKNQYFNAREYFEEICSLESIDYYYRLLWWHRKAVVKIASTLFPNDKQLMERVSKPGYYEYEPNYVVCMTLACIFNVKNLVEEWNKEIDNYMWKTPVELNMYTVPSCGFATRRERKWDSSLFKSFLKLDEMHFEMDEHRVDIFSFLARQKVKTFYQDFAADIRKEGYAKMINIRNSSLIYERFYKNASSVKFKIKVCDRLASVCGPMWRDQLECTIEQAAAVCKEKFPDWNDKEYPGTFDSSKCLFKELPEFPLHEEYKLINWLKKNLSSKVDFSEYIEEISKLKSIQFYYYDLWWNRKAVREIASKLFPENEVLADCVLIHNVDKYDPIYVVANTLFWLFNVDNFETRINIFRF